MIETCHQEKNPLRSTLMRTEKIKFTDMERYVQVSHFLQKFEFWLEQFIH